MESQEFDIQRESVRLYFYWNAVLAIALIGVFIFGFGVLAAPLWAFTLGPWLAKRQSEALRYRLEGTTIRIDQGVIFFKRKSIPLDRVTNFGLSQGPLLRFFGIWRLDIQTAATGTQTAEGYLYGLTDPEAVRDTLLTARDQAAKSGNYDGA
jgi:putative membrane protein